VQSKQKPKWTTRGTGTRGDPPTTTPDLGKEETDEHDGVRAVDRSPPVNLTTCKKTAPEVKTRGVDHDYTEPPPPCLGQAGGGHTEPRSADREQWERRHHREGDAGSTTNNNPNVVLKASYMRGDDGASTTKGGWTLFETSLLGPADMGGGGGGYRNLP
jgi:hypothetical protein